MQNPQTIAILGAGPSGLVTAKHLSQTGAFSQITLFESRDSVGGVWNFSSKRDTDMDGDRERNGDKKHPMYEDLETNIPKSMMCFEGLKYGDGVQLFPRRKDVKTYLEEYAGRLGEGVRICLGCEVVSLRRGGGGGAGWDVGVKRGKGREVEVCRFDAVVVATGQQYLAYFPPLEGLDEWEARYPGTILHSRDYRGTEGFVGKKILVIGNSSSGLDISRRIATVCKSPILISQSTPSSFFFKMPGSRLLPATTALQASTRTVYFQDGTMEGDIDILLFCTGYDHNYPFLPPSLLPPDTQKDFVPGNSAIVKCLYQYIFYCRDPTLVFVGVLTKNLPFSTAEAQGVVIARVFSGRMGLPGKEVMERWGGERFGGDGNRGKRGMRGMRASRVLALKAPRDLVYTNALLDWAVSGVAPIDSGSDDGAVSIEMAGNGRGDGRLCGDVGGGVPGKWDEEAFWIRSVIPGLKRAFDALGEGRRGITSMEMLGFVYEERGEERCG